MLLGLLGAVLLLLAASFFTSGFCLTLSSLDAFVVEVLLRVARAILACAGSTSCDSSSVCERLPIVEKKAGILRLGDATGGFCASTSATLSQWLVFFPLRLSVRSPHRLAKLQAQGGSGLHERNVWC